MPKLRLALALGLVATAVPASAATNTLTFLKMIDEGDTRLVVLLYGYATGYAWANSQLEAYGKEPLFCEPKDNAAITPEENIDLLRRYVKANPQFGQVGPRFGSLAGLRDEISVQVMDQTSALGGKWPFEVQPPSQTLFRKYNRLV